MSWNPNTDTPLEDTLEQLRHRCLQPFGETRPIPAALHHSKAFHTHEMNRVFASEWICIGRADEIPNYGDYITHEIASVSTLTVRQKDGNIASFVNACAHRFACVVHQKKGSAKKFTCPYHGWTYRTDGQLIGAPYMDMKPGFNRSDHQLKPLNTTLWEGFIYVTLAENPKTNLSEALRPLRDNVVGRYDMSCYKTILREKMIWKANWKNLIENFIESYHVPIAHGQTFAQHGKPLEEYIIGEDSYYYCYHRAAQESSTGLGAAHRNNDRLEGEWRRMMIDFCIFPSHLITLMPDYVWYISVQPRGTDEMEATWGVGIPPEVLNDIPENEFEKWCDEFKDYINLANGEDKALVEALHKGSRSPILPMGTYHPLEKNLRQFTQYLNRISSNS